MEDGVAAGYGLCDGHDGQPEDHQQDPAKKRPLIRRIWRYLKETWTGVITGSGSVKKKTKVALPIKAEFVGAQGIAFLFNDDKNWRISGSP